MNYDIREFNEWLKGQPSDGISWSISSSIQNGKIQKYFFSGVNDVHQCQPNLTWNKACLTVIKKWIKIKDLENSKRDEDIMENFDLNDYNRVGTEEYYYKAKDNKTVAVWTNCKCKRNFYQLWKPVVPHCFSCEEVKDLKKKNDEKDLIIENLKKKLTELEINSRNNQFEQSEIVEDVETDNKSENSDGFSLFD